MEAETPFDATFSRPRGDDAAWRHHPALIHDTHYGYGTAAGHPATLAADADRERAIDVLRAGFAEGRLDKAEHDDRAARAYAARTYGQLGALIADLPAGLPGGPAHDPAGYPGQMARPAVSPMATAAQAGQTGQRGDRMALAALIVGWTGLVAVIIAALIIAASVSGQGVRPVVVHAVPGGPVQGG